MRDLFRPCGLLAAVAGALGLAACGREESSGSRVDEPVRWTGFTAGADNLTGEVPILPDPGLPEDTLSVTITVESGSFDALSVGVRDRAQRVLTDPAMPEDSPNRMIRSRQMAVAAIPSATSTLPLGPIYRISAKRFTTRTEDVAFTAYIKRAATDVRYPAVRHAPAVQRLPSTLFLVGESPPDDGRLAIALGEMGRVLRAAGIEAGEPARVRLLGADFAKFDRVSVAPPLGFDGLELGELLELSAAGPQEGLPIFVIRSLLGDAGAPVLGLSAAIPVPPVRGTIRSGIVLNGEILDNDPILGGQVMAHEIGHALGLYHTTEADGTYHDTIDDSPTCPPEADTDVSGFLSVAECDPWTGGNLMFWSEMRGADRLTAGQGEIMRRSPLVR